MQFSGSKKKNTVAPFFVWGACLLVLFLIGKYFVFFKGFFIKTTSPLVQTAVVLQNQKDFLYSQATPKKVLLEEIARLKKENEDLVLSHADISKKIDTIERFDSFFGTLSKEAQPIFAQVISKPNHSMYDTLLIKKQNNEKVIAGELVFANQYTTIGTIDTVTDNTMLVSLFSTPERKTVARLERTGYDVTLIGRGGGNMIVEVPKEVETALGDKMVYPLNNKVIGVIADIILDEREPNKKLYITLPVNILTLENVYIERK